MVASTEMIAFFDTAQFSLVEVDRHLRCAYCLSHHCTVMMVKLSLLLQDYRAPNLKISTSAKGF
jgi:hypothetical protein